MACHVHVFEYVSSHDNCFCLGCVLALTYKMLSPHVYGHAHRRSALLLVTDSSPLLSTFGLLDTTLRMARVVEIRLAA